VGLEPLPQQTEDGQWYGFNTGAVTMSAEPESNKGNYPFVDNNHNQVLIQFKANTAEQLEQMNQHLESKGVRLLRRSEVMSYSTITNFLDSDGNLMEILLEKTA